MILSTDIIKTGAIATWHLFKNHINKSKKSLIILIFRHFK